MADAIFLFDDSGIIGLPNPAAEKMFGYNWEGVVGPKIQDFIYIDSENQVKSLAELYDLKMCSTYCGRTFSGSTIPIEIQTSNVLGIAERLNICLVRDHTAIVGKQIQVEVLAYFDTLTGLANRRLIYQRINMATTRALKSKLNGNPPINQSTEK